MEQTKENDWTVSSNLWQKNNPSLSECCVKPYAMTNKFNLTFGIYTIVFKFFLLFLLVYFYIVGSSENNVTTTKIIC